MIRPLNGNVVLKKEVTEHKTVSCIVLSQKAEEDYAFVVATSSYKDESGNLVEPEISVGDKVVYKSYSTTKVKDNEEEYLIVSYKDILAVIK